MDIKHARRTGFRNPCVFVTDFPVYQETAVKNHCGRVWSDGVAVDRTNRSNMSICSDRSIYRVRLIRRPISCFLLDNEFGIIFYTIPSAREQTLVHSSEKASKP